MEEQLLPFIDSLLKEKNLSGMTEEVFAQLRRDMSEDLQKQIDRAIISELSDEQADEFSALMDKHDTTDETLQKFIEASGIDVTAIIAQTMARFREYYIGITTATE